MKGKTATVRPDPAQIKAIERDVQAGDYRRALQRAGALTERFPAHAPSWAWRAKLEYDLSQHGAAARSVARWCELSPKSAAAWNLAEYVYSHLGLPFLAREAAQRRGEIDGDVRRVVEAEHRLEQARHEVGGDELQGLAFDRAMLLDYCDRPEESIRMLAGIDLPLARLNLGLTQFQLGRMAEARQTIESLLLDWADPRALCRAVQLRLIAGESERARTLLPLLSAARVSRADQLRDQIVGLLLLDAYEAAVLAYRGGEDALAAAIPSLRAEVINAYAIAALWYGEAGAAQEAWGRSLEQNGEHFITQYNLRGQLEPVERRVAPVLAGASRWLPISRSDGRPLSDGCSYSTPYRRVVLKFASPELRDLMLEQLFAAAPTELAAKAVLVEAVGWRVGPDSARLALLGRLVEQGLIDRRAILQVTLFGATHEVQLLLPESLRNATLWDSADAQASNCAAAVLLLQSKQFEAARAMLRRCLEDSPQHVVLSCLLAEALCQGPAPDYETANRLLDEILLARPDYLRARALRASVFLGRHELIAARDELESCAAIDASNSLDLTLLHRVWFDYSVAAADAAGKHRSACHVYLIEALAAKLNPAA